MIMQFFIAHHTGVQSVGRLVFIQALRICSKCLTPAYYFSLTRCASNFRPSTFDFRYSTFDLFTPHGSAFFKGRERKKTNPHSFKLQVRMVKS